MKILITGGAGFIGSHLADELVKEHEVIVVDINETHVNPKARFINESVLNLEKMKEACKDINIIFHLAANPSVQESMEKPTETFKLNTIGTLNMLEAARHNKIKNFLFTSSSTVYGIKNHLIKEDEKHEPISVYGASKSTSDKLLQAYTSFGMNCTSLVLANVYGPRNKRGVMKDFNHKLKENPNKLEILGDGTQEKSYVYIKDAINAMKLAMKHMKGYQAINVASNETTTVNKIADLIIKEMGLNTIKEYTGSSQGWKGDVPKVRLDNTKIKNMGWQQETSIEQGIKEYINHLKNK